MLARAIRSALAQTFKHIKVFVVDNASGDHTEQVALSFVRKDSRVVYHRHDGNIGMNENFLYGMTHVSTPYFSFLSDDDVLLPEFYETAYSEFRRFPSAIFTALRVLQVTDDGRLLNDYLSKWDRHGFFCPPEGCYRVVVEAPVMTGILWSRELLDQSNVGIDTSIYCWDHAMLFDAAINHPIISVDKPGGLFVCHQETRAQPSNIRLLTDFDLALIKRVDEDARFTAEMKLANRKKAVRYHGSYLRGNAIKLIAEGNHYLAEEVLTVRSKGFGVEDSIGSLLEKINGLCKHNPKLSSLVRHLYEYMYCPVSRIRNIWLKSRLPFIDSRFLEVLRLE